MTTPDLSHNIVLRDHNFNAPPTEMAKNTLFDLQKDLYEVRGGGPIVYNGGYQITPTRAIMSALKGRSASEYLGLAQTLEESDYYDPNQPIFTSGEQSWSRGLVGGARFLWGQRNFNGAIQMAGGVIVQEQAASLGGLAKLQKMRPEGQMHAVVYSGTWRRHGEAVQYGDHPFASVSTQLHPEQMLDTWNISPRDLKAYEQVKGKLDGQGIPAVTIDPVHMWRQHDDFADLRMNPWRLTEVIRDLNIPIADFHFGTGRVDRKGDDRRTSMQELEVLIRNPDNFSTTMSGEIFDENVETWYLQNIANPDAKLNIVNESPYKGLQSAGLAETREQWYRARRTMARNIRHLAASALKKAQAKHGRP